MNYRHEPVTATRRSGGLGLWYKLLIAPSRSRGLLALLRQLRVFLPLLLGLVILGGFLECREPQISAIAGDVWRESSDCSHSCSFLLSESLHRNFDEKWKQDLLGSVKGPLYLEIKNASFEPRHQPALASALGPKGAERFALLPTARGAHQSDDRGSGGTLK